MSKPKRRVPQQDRGERRVAEVLEAAAATIAEVGYEAATMTEVAERAGASIGILYQYFHFPNKEATMRALRQQYGDEMEARWTPAGDVGSGEECEVGEGADPSRAFPRTKNVGFQPFVPAAILRPGALSQAGMAWAFGLRERS